MAEEAVLGHLKHNQEISDSGVFSQEKGIDHEELVNVIKRLNGFGFVIASDIKREKWLLSEEAQSYVKYGSAEVLLFEAVPAEGIAKAKLQDIVKSKLPADLDDKTKSLIYDKGWAQAMKNKWIGLADSQVSRKATQDTLISECSSSVEHIIDSYTCNETKYLYTKGDGSPPISERITEICYNFRTLLEPTPSSSKMPDEIAPPKTTAMEPTPQGIFDSCSSRLKGLLDCGVGSIAVVFGGAISSGILLDDGVGSSRVLKL